MATLINGDGNPAVYAAQDADMLSGAFTNDKTVILDVGEKFRADVLSSSLIEVHDGVILTKEGRRIQLDQNAVDLFEIPAGEQGETSYYWIGYKLEIDEDSHQICNTFVQKMDDASDTIPEGSFRAGDTEVYISLYHVVQDSLGVLTPTIGINTVMTMIDLLDLIGDKTDLPDQTKSVIKNIDQISSDLSATVSIEDATGFTVDSMSSFARSGNTVAGNLVAAGTTAIQTWSVIGNIDPSPNKVVNAPLVNDGTGAADGFIRITTTGEIRMFPLTSGLANRSAVIAYQAT